MILMLAAPMALPLLPDGRDDRCPDNLTHKEYYECEKLLKREHELKMKRKAQSLDSLEKALDYQLEGTSLDRDYTKENKMILL